LFFFKHLFLNKNDEIPFYPQKITAVTFLMETQAYRWATKLGYNSTISAIVGAATLKCNMMQKNSS